MGGVKYDAGMAGWLSGGGCGMAERGWLRVDGGMAAGGKRWTQQTDSTSYMKTYAVTKDFL